MWPLLLLLVSQPDPAGLRWDAPAECPSRDEAAAYLQEELHGDPEQGLVDVVVTANDGGWTAQVSIDGAPARTLEAAACEDLMAAAMVVVAVTRDTPPAPAPPTPAPPSLVPEIAETTEPAPDPNAQPSPPQTPPPERTPAKREPTPPPMPLQHWLGVDAGAGWLHVGAVTGRLGLRYALRGPSWSMRVGAQFEVPRELRYAGERFGGRFSAAVGELAGCYEPGRGALRGVFCAGAGLGAVFGSGVGVQARETPTAFTADARAIAGLHWSWSPKWRLAIEGTLSAGLARPAFHVGERDPLLQTPLVGGLGTIGIERRLP